MFLLYHPPTSSLGICYTQYYCVAGYMSKGRKDGGEEIFILTTLWFHYSSNHFFEGIDTKESTNSQSVIYG